MKVIGKELCKDVVDAMKEASQEAQMKRLGSLGGVMFYCRGYMSPGHVDFEKCMAITAQLCKVAQPDEYHFAYVKWGFYIETTPGAVWSVSASTVQLL